MTQFRHRNILLHQAAEGSRIEGRNYMTPEKFGALGRAAYGFGWQSKVADLLGVHRSTVMRWYRGQEPIPPEKCNIVAQKAAAIVAEAVLALGLPR